MDLHIIHVLFHMLYLLLFVHIQEYVEDIFQVKLDLFCSHISAILFVFVNNNFICFFFA